MRKYLPTLFIVFLLTSCGHPSAVSLSSKSPDGNTEIKIDAKKASGLDPYTVTLKTLTGGKETGSAQFEITVSEMNESNVKFKWADANNAQITFTQTDGGQRVFVYFADANNVILKETKNE